MKEETVFADHVESLQKQIGTLEKILEGNVIFFQGDVNTSSVYILHKILRKGQSMDKLFLVIESSGGNIDSAAKLVHLCKEYCRELNSIVPHAAKSAATLTAVSSDNLYLGKAGELGPIDPQVKHPLSDYYFSVLSIKDAVDFIKETEDPYVKMVLTDKLDPWLLGGWKRMDSMAKQYLERSNLVKKSNNSKGIIEELTHKYISHGYPIDRKICRRIKLEVSDFDNSIWNSIYEIFETQIDFILEHNVDFEYFVTSKNNFEYRIYQRRFLKEKKETKTHSDKIKNGLLDSK